MLDVLATLAIRDNQRAISEARPPPGRQASCHELPGAAMLHVSKPTSHIRYLRPTIFSADDDTLIWRPVTQQWCLVSRRRFKRAGRRRQVGHCRDVMGESTGVQIEKDVRQPQQRARRAR